MKSDSSVAVAMRQGFFGIAAAMISLIGVADGAEQTQAYGGGAVSIGDNQPGTPYPSAVNVAGMVGPITKVTVQLDGLTHTYPADLDIALVGPGGHTMILMSDTGYSSSINGVSLTLDSAALTPLPGATQIFSGEYQPANYDYGPADVFPAPAPAGPYGTNFDVFNGLDANGIWGLYVVDDAANDVGSLGSWVLTITTTGTIPPPDTTPDSFTFTDISDVALGVVQVSNAVTITGINTAAPISVTGGEYSIGCDATFTTADSTISNGQTVCVRHTSAATNATSTDTTLTVGGVTDTFTSNTSLPGGDQTQPYAGGAVSIGDNQPGTPYPSTVNVTGMDGIISKVTVQLDGLTHTYPADLDIALVGPGGHAMILMSDTGYSSSINGVSLTLDSAALTPLPGATQIFSGEYQPANYDYGPADVFPAPAPAGPYGTNFDVFNGLDANGTWGLYVVDDVPADFGSLGSWVLTMTTTGTLPPPDTTPDSFTFTDISDVALGVVQVSNAVTITGINTAAPISVTGGEYSIGCDATFTTADSTISNGQTVCVRHTSAATNATSTDTTLTVGGVADTFTSTTAGSDTDDDGIPDSEDNCTQLANADQIDSDSDGYGNRCDGDLNNNGATNAQDVAMFRQLLGSPSTPPTYNIADLNANGTVNAQDVAMFRQLLGSPPGPSGLVP